jgi:acyl carrier protein
MNNTFTELKIIISKILDIDPEKIGMDTYIIRDLGAESIDLLELAVKISGTFKIEVNDDRIFLKKFRSDMNESLQQNGNDPADALLRKYPQLTAGRIHEIIEDLKNGPVLRTGDICSYIEWKQKC